jgi:phage gp36-like protein
VCENISYFVHHSQTTNQTVWRHSIDIRFYQQVLGDNLLGMGGEDINESDGDSKPQPVAAVAMETEWNQVE